MEESKQEIENSEFNLPINMIKFKTYASFESTLPPVITSVEQLMENLNISGMGLTICKPNPSFFSVPTRVPYSDFICPPSWESILNTDEARCELARVYDKLRQKVYQGETIFPKEDLMFRAFRECNLSSLKVVIIGQDPYHKIDNVLDIEIASGLSFSGLYGGEKPSSMNKIFKEIERTFPEILLEHCELTSWARQGVLLLNTSLTVRMGDANSHGKEKLWKYYIEYVLKKISDENPNVIFLLWGAASKELSERTVDPPISRKAKVLKCGHPSGLNCSSKNPASRFEENGHFSAVWYDINNQNIEIQKKNEKLQQQGLPLLPYVQQIDWSLTHAGYQQMKQQDQWLEQQKAIALSQGPIEKVGNTEEEKFELDEPVSDSINSNSTIVASEVSGDIQNSGELYVIGQLNTVSSNGSSRQISIQTDTLEYTQEQIDLFKSQGFNIEQIQQYQQYYTQQYYQQIHLEKCKEKSQSTI